MRWSILASILFLAAATPAAVAAQTPSEAAALYRDMKVRAEAGDAEAQWEIGMMLLNGDGVTRNEREAWRWVRASGDAGHEKGMISTPSCWPSVRGRRPTRPRRATGTAGPPRDMDRHTPCADSPAC